MTRVAVFGGGMGGLAAAHELAERGFEVDLYEKRDIWGGKARSYGLHGTGTDGREDLPAEHGFRFFPGFYKHVPDTMRRIPYPEGGPGARVSDNLVQCQVGEMLRADAAPTIFPVRFPRSFKELRERVADLRGHGPLGLEPGELRYFLGRLWRIATSCQERRLKEYEQIPWWTYVGAASRSVAYQKLLARGMTRSLVAMRAEVAATRTVADILLQMAYYALTPGASSDRVLNGPTSKVWLDPWRAHLRALGVRFHDRERLVRLVLGDDGAIAHAEVRGASDMVTRVEADHYVAAVPVEVMSQLVEGPLAEAAPSLARLHELSVEWMNGVQFYLSRDIPLVYGHSLYVDSTWALTSISQPQFWRQGAYPLEKFGDGRVKGLLSVDISDWDDPGEYTTGADARYCSRDQVIEEVWAQVQHHLAQSGYGPLRDDERLHAHLDNDIECPAPDSPEAECRRLAARHGLMKVREMTALQPPLNGPGPKTMPWTELRQPDRDLEPLLINTVGSWADRPEATTEIPNLFLASDYVRTYTDLATMEGANEAGRRAVNAILDAEASPAPRCRTWPLHEPLLLAPFRAIDWIRFRMGQRSGESPL